MQELHITVSNKVATYRRRDGFIVCGNSDYMVIFAFDAEWDAHEEKTARFVWNNQYIDRPFTGNVDPEPEKAISDAANQVRLSDVESILKQALAIEQVIRLEAKG